MSYRCVTHGCNNEAIFDLNICEECLECCAKKNAENFGPAESYICGWCGETFSPTDFIGHICEYGEG